MNTMNDTELLQKLRDTNTLIRYFESAEGEWANELAVRLKAREEFAELISQASKRELNWLECLE